MNIPEEDKHWLKTKALPYFSIKKIGLDEGELPDGEIWPDIWLAPRGRLKVIYVTSEWRKQNSQNRRRRLTHELLHVKGVHHDGGEVYINGLLYSTWPHRDRFSMTVYNDIQKGSPKWEPRKFGC